MAPEPKFLSITIDDPKEERETMQFHISKATGSLLTDHHEYYVQAVVDDCHCKDPEHKHRTGKRKRTEAETVFDENLSLMVLQPSSSIKLQLVLKSTLLSNIVAETKPCLLSDLIAQQGTTEDRQKFITLPLHPCTKKRSASFRRPRGNSSTRPVTPTTPHSDGSVSPGPGSPSLSPITSPRDPTPPPPDMGNNTFVVLNIRNIVRDTAKEAKTWLERRKGSASPPTPSIVLSPVSASRGEI